MNILMVITKKSYNFSYNLLGIRHLIIDEIVHVLLFGIFFNTFGLFLLFFDNCDFDNLFRKG